MQSNKISRPIHFSMTVFNGLLRLYPKSYRKRFGLDMQITFEKICTSQVAEGGMIGLAKELAYTLWDIVRAGPSEYFWLAVDIGNKKLLSITSSALILAGVAYISPVCPMSIEGEDNAKI